MIQVSCEKVIELDLREADKKYVIEGIITDQSEKARVLISQTGPFTADNHFEGVNGAAVRITEEGGTGTLLAQVAPGEYEGDLKGVPGKRYTLSVTIAGREYKAVSQMPQPVAISRLYLSEMSMGGKREKQVNLVYNDPPEVENHYRFVVTINGQKQKEVYTRKDDLSNGRLTTVSLYPHDSTLKPGDTVSIQLLSIDPQVYNYWYSLDQGAEGSGSVTPANPISNISGGALGYFSAHALREKSLLVP